MSEYKPFRLILQWDEHSDREAVVELSWDDVRDMREIDSSKLMESFEELYKAVTDV